MNASKKTFETPGLSADEVKDLSKTFTRFQDLEEVVLFGSRAMGNHKQGSDVDLALKGNLKQDTRFEIHEILEEETLFPYFFDILEFNSIQSPELLSHIKAEGKVIYKK